MEKKKMKIRRFLSVFLLTLLLTGLFCVPQASAVEMPQVNAKAALLMDYESGRMLYGLNEKDTEYPASITKVMTALLTLEAVDQGVLTLDQPVTAPSLVNDMDPTGSSADIKEGEVLTVEQLLYCMMLVSANEAACILAETVSGSQDAFVALMNQRAQELGCTGTHFVNPNGLHDPNHYSTAWDIYLITREAMKNETFMKICGTAAYVVPATNKSEERELYTTNSLISNWRIMGYQYDGADGIKTGSTEESGYCLLSTAKRSGRRLVAVVLGCKGSGATVESFSETAKLYNWAYNNFSMRQVAATDELYRQPVALSKQTDTVMLYPAQSAEAFLPKDAKDEDIRKTVDLKEDVVNAPITAGQELGTLTITYNDQVCAQVPLLAQADVSASRFLVAKAAVEAFFAKTWVKLALVAIVVLVSIGQGANSSVVESIEGMGTNLITANINARRMNPIDLDSLNELALNEAISYVAPISSVSGTVKAGAATYDDGVVQGTTPGYESIRNWTVAEGRFLQQPDIDNRSFVAVIGSEAATEMYGTTHAVGETFSLNGYTLTVVGVLAQVGSSASGSNDNQILIPFTLAQRLSNQTSISSFYVSAASSSQVEQAQAAVESYLEKAFANYNTNSFGTQYSVFNQSEMLSTLSETTNTLTLMLGGIAAISLLVGGIGIMNIMLVSVSERTREIGIRKAIGAARGNILMQFLIESLVVSLMGGLLGLAISVAAVKALAPVLQMTLTIPVNVAWMAIGFSVFIGVVFGMYPANKASKLRPIEALHYEG